MWLRYNIYAFEKEKDGRRIGDINVTLWTEDLFVPSYTTDIVLGTEEFLSDITKRVKHIRKETEDGIQFLVLTEPHYYEGTFLFDNTIILCVPLPPRFLEKRKTFFVIPVGANIGENGKHAYFDAILDETTLEDFIQPLLQVPKVLMKLHEDATGDKCKVKKMEKEVDEEGKIEITVEIEGTLPSLRSEIDKVVERIEKLIAGADTFLAPPPKIHITDGLIWPHTRSGGGVWWQHVSWYDKNGRLCALIDIVSIAPFVVWECNHNPREIKKAISRLEEIEKWLEKNAFPANPITISFIEDDWGEVDFWEM